MTYEVATLTLIFLIKSETNAAERQRLRRQLLKVRYAMRGA
jgi:hypothetical protein